MDTVGQWLAECTSTEDPSATATPPAIMDSYVWWCDMQSIPERERLGRNKLLEEVRSRPSAILALDASRACCRRSVGMEKLLNSTSTVLAMVAMVRSRGR
jgi:hypothetical protein